MKVSGFTFIRNAVKNDYPIVEGITSALPLCDEFIVALGDSDDGTGELIAAINSAKIKVIDTVWDTSERNGGKVFADQTDIAYKAIAPDADWAFYIQGDECVHEKYLPTIKKEMEACLNDKSIEGLLFKYLHFYGSYDYYGQSRRWYRREIRILRHNPGVQSYRDAQGFRLEGRKLNVKLIDAYIYHYGWAKPPKGLNNKVRNFNRFYHDDNWLEQNVPETFEFDYSNADRLLKFEGTHPAVMQKRIAATRWDINFDKKQLRKGMDTRRRVLQWIENVFGWRIGEYRNYKIVK
ncbi:glycosyltransferase family 2 protein [Mucilaginibacter psychrotolerans]|uniref:Glycosyltransferase family 2 protein n=1 Tax=Mucilaginibacter psychrotolerans TaxID=1524096 RepID=A0A4Y8S889_9SPHI|nr:glycosyltransferase family 2 protein [Mucilaginibacter psychrotolerans]TFF34820.1 glycosyltransferase family 2 protein [Mucilaginibacter psychrotolerans]